MTHRCSIGRCTTAFAFLLLAATSLPLGAQPVAVSPGSPTGGVISDGCPTFSWGQVAGASEYELVVYSADVQRDGAPPVLSTRIHGSASSWTPTLASCLGKGERYAWSVRAIGAEGARAWSAPQLFEVAPGPSEAELEKALAVVREYLSENQPPAGRGSASADADRSTSAPIEVNPLQDDTSGAPPVPSISTDGRIEAPAFGGPGGGPLVTESLAGSAGPIQLLSPLVGLPGAVEILGPLAGVSGTPLEILGPLSGLGGAPLEIGSPLTGAGGAPLLLLSPVELLGPIVGPPGSTLDILIPINPLTGIIGFSPGPHTMDTTCDGIACDGTSFSNVDAASLGGTPAASFVPGPHTRALTSLEIAQNVCDACFVASNSGCNSLCDIPHPSFSTSSVSTCFGNVFDSGGSSGNYSNNESGSLQLCTAGGPSTLRLLFEEFHTEDIFDRLWIFDGSGEPTLGASCADDPTPAGGQILLTPGGLAGTPSTPLVYTSGPSNCLTLQFCSDGSVTRSGWAARLSCS